MNARNRIAAASISLAALLGAGCATAPEKPVAMEAVIGNNFGHLPMFVGVEKGLFKKHGVDLKLKVVNTGTDMVSAMTKREVQIGDMSLATQAKILRVLEERAQRRADVGLVLHDEDPAR